MHASRKRWTVEEIRALPEDGNRYELVDGVLLVTPSPTFRHQGIAFELAVRLHEYLRGEPVGTVLMAPADVRLAETTVVEPDILVIPYALHALPENADDAELPVLVVEVLSPGTAGRDRIVKRRLYQEHGIPEYWIVDPVTPHVERWRPGDERPEILTERLEWMPDGAGSVCIIDLAGMFTALGLRQSDSG